MNKAVKIVLIVLGSIVGLLLLLYAILWIVRSAMYSESMKYREYVCDVPEINSGYAPQGITHTVTADGKEIYLMTGYDGDNNTVLYISENNVSRRVYLSGADGNDLKGHAGGIACTKDCVYIANGSMLHVYSLAALVAAQDKHVPILKEIPVDNTAAYVFSDENNLYVGEFYRAGNYETAESHRYTTPNGQANTAIVSCYTLDGDGLINKTNPEYCISITGLVQGFAVKDGVYMLSRSYGLSNSALEYYSEPKDGGAKIKPYFPADPERETTEVPLYYLDSTCLTKSLTLPAFSEDLTIAGDRVVVTNESACNKYIVGKLFGGWVVYSYPIHW